ncbi:MAG: N-acetylglucosamine-6-phosphate deacetylase [Acidimicrobiales bacterium]
MTEQLVVRSEEIVTAAAVVDGYVLLEGARISAVEAGEPPEGMPARVIDVRPDRVLPGLIDVHVHGAGGWGAEAGDIGQLRQLARLLASHGVTSFQPSVPALSPERLDRAVAGVRDAAVDPPGDGARMLGMHWEGPYLNPSRHGAMDRRCFRDPSRDEVERAERLAPGVLRHLTIAPERPGAVEFIRWLAGRGDVVVSGGHTDATYAEARAGIDAGIRLANHTYNAMRGLAQREPGALAAFALDERVTCELIADGLHVHPVAMDALVRMAGPGRICLVSDAVLTAGLPVGEYSTFGRRTRVTEEGLSRYEDGTLAGSTQLLLAGVRNMVDLVGVSLVDAVRMASLVPATVVGEGGHLGSVAPGKDADLVVVSPDWARRWTIIGGEVAWSPVSAPAPTNPEVLRA